MDEVADAVSQAEDVAERQMKAVDEMAKAVHGAADRLSEQMPQAAELVHAAASRVEKGAEALRERNIGDLIGTFNDMGRKEPLALFCGAAVAGFAMSRFLKSSSNRSRRGE